MHDEELLLDVLLERVNRSPLSEDQQTLVLAAFEGDLELGEALTGARDLAHTREEVVTAVARQHGYLSAVSVRGFRGIGPEATLRLEPGPGLTLVIGRNGSGKSSFAEGVEAALTGTSFRWRGKTKDWLGGWHNLHEPAPASVVLQLAIDGDRGRTTVTRTWTGQDLEQSECWVQRPGAPRASLASLGWDTDLVTYRPFLSYSELGQIIAGRPSEMYDALASILGLEQIADAERRLNDARKQLDSETRQVQRDLDPLLRDLEAVDDDRARTALTALQRRNPNLSELAALATGVSDDAQTGAIELLRRIAQLAPPAQERVAEVVADLRSAAAALARTRGTPAEESRLLADLLERALKHREGHAEQATCPVCGTEAVLDDSWEQRTRREVDRLRAVAGAAEAAHAQVRQALAAAHAVLAEPPHWLSEDSPVRGPWRAWAEGESLEDPLALADHLERTSAPLHTACDESRNQAARRLRAVEDAWRPVALRLDRWVRQAQTAAGKQRQLGDVKKAHDWLRTVALDIRNERLRPLAEQSAEIWQQLRQESNVELGPITLEGKATSRKVALDITVDGVDGTALGVMSQGELHALALAMFLPRATVPDSPFRFLVIDDPVQSMDPAKVDGLARVLSETGKERQVVVFTHDTRLADAVRRLKLPATIWEVVRRENSVVELRRADDPAKRALDDARMLLKTQELPSGVAARVVPGLCRSALEVAFVELARGRRLAAGVRHAEVESEIAAAQRLQQLAALALVGDVNKGGEVFNRLNRYGVWAVNAYKACRTGGHAVYRGDLQLLVKGASRLVECIRDER